MALSSVQWFELIGFAAAALLVGWALDSLMESDEPRLRSDG